MRSSSAVAASSTALNWQLPPKLTWRIRSTLQIPQHSRTELPATQNQSPGKMVFATTVGKYQLGRTIGEGTFAKVKLAVNTETGQSVAVKIIDKQMVMENKLMYQVKREISSMKLLHHPNIVRIYEVVATKTKIYIVMEYVVGGQLSDKMAYLQRLSEGEARKYFQQLIDAVDYCHCRGVYHRDLKPQNLLLDGKGYMKISDFGLSILRKPGDLLSTACGSPSYVAPEVIANKNYDGASADVWSCGVILYELLAGDLPFDDQNIMNLYKKICSADYTFPKWFPEGPRHLISRILNPTPTTRITVAEILEDKWFQTDYEPSVGISYEESINLDDVNAAFESMGQKTDDPDKEKPPNFINAFQLIAMSNDLNLSGLFKEQDDDKQRRRFGSKHSINETIEKIEAAAKDVNLSVERKNNSKVKLHEPKTMTKSRSYFSLSAEVIEVTPTHCVVDISKSGETEVYKEFCRSLSTVLRGIPISSSELKLSSMAGSIEGGDTQKTGCSNEEGNSKESKDFLRGYSSS